MFSERAEKVARRCIEAGREFWGIDTNLDVRLSLERIDDGTTPANCNILGSYHRAYITIDPGQCKDLAEVWENTAHEIAHLVLVEMELFFDATADSVDESAPLKRIMRHGVERTVSQLERVFLRERAYPGDEHFEVITP